MASRAFFISTIVFAVIAAPILAMDYMVGDDAGWALGVDYTQWAKGKQFYVGDNIMFMYTPGKHNVLKVGGDDFQKCASSNTTAVPMTSGNDTITLAAPGNKWYICDIGDHCKKGMKLVVTVSSADGPAPAPQPGTSATDKASPLRYSVWILALVAAFKIIIAN